MRIVSQHLALSVAAALARSQLVPDAVKNHDTRHREDMLNLVAMALGRAAPLYTSDPRTGRRRQLAPGELEGAHATHAATVLVLKDGRTLSSLTVRRGDLRQAIAILKAIGLHDIAPNVAPAALEPKPAAGASASESTNALLARLTEMERELAQPLLPEQVNKAKKAAVFIARNAKHGRVANLAMQLMSALQDSRDLEDLPGGYRMALARLRAALEAQRDREPQARRILATKRADLAG